MRTETKSVQDHLMAPRERFTAKRITCADGFSISVQAHDGAYCRPRDSQGPWYKVELGFPSEALGPEFTEYCEDPEKPTETVYGYVPIELVEALIARHGGFAVA
jgi:hypothetical protein